MDCSYLITDINNLQLDSQLYNQKSIYIKKDGNGQLVKTNCSIRQQQMSLIQNKMKMSRTLSRQKCLRKSTSYLPSGNQKTQKKKGKIRNVSLITKNTTWLPKHQSSSIFQQESTSSRIDQYKNQKIQQQKYLKIFNPPNIKINRARIIDWLLDVCRAFQLRWESYWCAIELLDFMIVIVDFVKVSNIHIVAVTCLFMGVKIHQTTPPLLDKIIQKAVYHSFSSRDVLVMEAQILLFSVNTDVKPRYLTTVYNYLYEIYPKMALKQRVEALRRLVVIWMDPVMALRNRLKNPDCIYVPYDEVVKTVVKGIHENQDISSFDKVQYYFKDKYECQNLCPLWPGFDKIKM